MALFTPKAPRPPQPPAKPKGLGRRRKTSAVRDVPRHTFGPRYLKLFALPGTGSDHCTPWPTFVGAHTSLSEQMAYEAIARVTGDPPQPQHPPYVGGVSWTYQDPLLGGRLSKGGQVCDFLVSWGSEDICIRLQSFRYHVTAEMAKRADEFFEKVHATARIVDIFEDDFVADCSLRAACAVIANALAGRDSPDPALLGTAQAARRRGKH